MNSGSGQIGTCMNSDGAESTAWHAVQTDRKYALPLDLEPVFLREECWLKKDFQIHQSQDLPPR